METFSLWLNGPSEGGSTKYIFPLGGLQVHFSSSLARKSQLASSACAAFNNNLACMQEAQLFRVVILGNKEEGARARGRGRANMILGAR